MMKKNSSSIMVVNNNKRVKHKQQRDENNLVKFGGCLYEQVEVELRSTTTTTTTTTSNTNGNNSGSNESVSVSTYGMVIGGYCPCHVERVVDGSVSFGAGVRRGDLIVRVNGVNCCRARLKSVLGLIRQTQPLRMSLKLTLYRPRTTTNGGSEKGINSSSTFVYHNKKEEKITDSSSSSRLHKKSLKKPKQAFFSRLLKPSLWRLSSCAHSNNQTLHHYSSSPSASSTITKSSSPSTTKQQLKQHQQQQQQPIYTSLIESSRRYYYYYNNNTNNNNNLQHSENNITAEYHNTCSKHILSATVGDTGYETLTNPHNTNTNENCATTTTMSQLSNIAQMCATTMDEEEKTSGEVEIDDFEVTMTVNSYSDCGDLTLDTTTAAEKKQRVRGSGTVGGGNERFNEMRTKLIGDLIEIEANFVSYLTMAVSAFSRPLRGFFMKQHDYFCLFQNIEKILVISENFLRSMDKWSAYDLYTKIGQLYSHKMSLFKEAYTIYARGHAKSKSLLAELRRHSKQFRLFLAEVESPELALERFLDLPIMHIHATLDIFKRIRCYTIESRRNPTEAPHIDSVILELKHILAASQQQQLPQSLEQSNVTTIMCIRPEDDMTTTMTTTNTTVESDYDDDDGFTIDEEDEDEEENAKRSSLRTDVNSCCSSSASSSSSEDSCCSSVYDEEKYKEPTRLMCLSPIYHHF